MLAFITSYRGHPLSPTDLLIEDTHPDFAQTGLKTKSVIKLDKLVTVESAILLGELGELSDVLLQQANVKLRHALEL
jgi:mRNA interferase MazF